MILFFRKYIKNNHKVVDFACGTGTYTRLLATITDE
jgi:ubiquinone/menaquinone biosynthesis C-methylase UbiE